MPTSFEDFVAARGLALTRFAYMLCGDRHHAEDLTQTALERCYSRWRRVGTPARQPEAYVKKAITNEYISSRRRASTRELVTEHPPVEALPDHAATAAEHDLLWRALAELSAVHRAVLVLRYYEDLDDAAIAGVLGCARATVRSSASRALSSLRLDPLINQKESGS